MQLNNVRALLSYAIKEYGYDSRWKPLEADDLRDLIGTDDRPTDLPRCKENDPRSKEDDR